MVAVTNTAIFLCITEFSLHNGRWNADKLTRWCVRAPEGRNTYRPSPIRMKPAQYTTNSNSLMDCTTSRGQRLSSAGRFKASQQVVDEFRVRICAMQTAQLAFGFVKQTGFRV